MTSEEHLALMKILGAFPGGASKYGFTTSLLNVISRSMSVETAFEDTNGVNLPRHYHTMGHVCDVYNEASSAVKNMFGANPDTLAATLAFALYHDVVYVGGPPRASENASFTLFHDHLLDKWIELPPELAALVGAGILATANYAEQQRNLPELVQAWLDADLAGLAGSFPSFTQNTINVRREIFYVPDDAFAQGRLKFLEAMMRRCDAGGLYYLTVERTEQAHENLRREYSFLVKGGTFSMEGPVDETGALLDYTVHPDVANAAPDGE